MFSAFRASPPARVAISSWTSGDTRTSSASAPRRTTPSSVSSECDSSSYTCARERSAEFTSKYGFSVVAPINVTSPSSTPGSSASCCALLKRWISSRKRIVRRPVVPSRSRARASTSRTSFTVAETADSSSNAAPVEAATIRASVVFPLPGGPYRIEEWTRSSSIARRNAEPSPSTCAWPTNSPSVAGRSRCASGATSLARRSAASEKRSLMPPVCSGNVSGSAADTWSGASYERIAETFAPIHDRVVRTLAVEPGTRLLDVACGTGGVALRAARADADVTGIDISADQLAKARRAAEAEGLAIRLDEGDCQELPYADAEFDAVASAFGAIFAPDQERTAAELARVCRPG